MSTVVEEYIAARNAYEDATKPLNSHGPVRRLPHGDPIITRYREARAALDSFIQSEMENEGN